MNELERAILAEIQKNGETDDPLSKAARRYNKKPKTNIKKYLLIPAAIVGIALCTYCIDKEMLNTKYEPVAIPVTIWGVCGISYSIRKLIA